MPLCVYCHHYILTTIGNNKKDTKLNKCQCKVAGNKVVCMIMWTKKKINQTADFLIQLRYKAWFSLVMQVQAQAQTQA